MYLNTMRCFLYYHYKKTKSDDIGSLGGDLNLCDDDQVTFDPASWHEWLEFTQRKKSMSSIEVFEAMVKFIDNYRINTKSKDLAALLSEMEVSKSGVIAKPEMANLWDECVAKALQEDTQWQMS